jgi:hypothetical protein
MRPCLTALCFACFPLAALADSVHTIEVVNDTRGSIDTFAMAPAGSGRWTEMDFRDSMQDSWFDYELAVTLAFHDHDESCLRDLRTVLSDGRRILVRNFNMCRHHAYRPGTFYRNDHVGSWVMR